MRLRMAKQLAPAKFIELVSGQGLMALDAAGSVWVYVGKEYGWAKLNMDRLSKHSAELAYDKKFSDVEFDWRDEADPND
jgi:hypothetical protein